MTPQILVQHLCRFVCRHKPACVCSSSCGVVLHTLHVLLSLRLCALFLATSCCPMNVSCGRTQPASPAFWCCEFCRSECLLLHLCVHVPISPLLRLCAPGPCQAPGAAVTQHPRPDGYRQQKRIISQFWGPMSKIKASAGLCSFCNL